MHLDFEGSDQRVFRVNDNVSRLPLKFIADRKLHLCSPLSISKIAQFSSPVSGTAEPFAGAPVQWGDLNDHCPAQNSNRQPLAAA